MKKIKERCTNINKIENNGNIDAVDCCYAAGTPYTNIPATYSAGASELLDSFNTGLIW